MDMRLQHEFSSQQDTTGRLWVPQSGEAHCSRRTFLRTAGMMIPAALLPFWTVRGAFAEELTRTPPQTEGPFYPNRLPLDTDNDLLIINDSITPAVGEITHLTGQVLDPKGQPVNNAVVEIWQCDAKGVYLHTSDSARKQDQQDKNFQGFGRFITGSKGEFYFRTIKPVPYPGRTPHIHFKIKKGRRELLTTQLYIQGHPQNERDGIWRSIRDPKQRDNVTRPFEKIPESKIGEWRVHFVIVLGVTPES
ncbi:MAG: protocatechuate 3,4-dioxygenase [Gemmataceae bacterium]|nr:protocatechuate 3,4-dioxygenase [Thermogemmata fonticola]MCX8138180.1 protocatechuate 3,4-dioxygenase [Gemmataceae bacterium]